MPATPTNEARRHHRDARLLLTVRDAAQRLNCGRSLLYQLIADGELETIKLGRLRRVPVDAVEALVDRLRERS